MKIKTNTFSISQFDLLGYKETSLCKAFAFLLAQDKQSFSAILRNIFNISHSTKYWNTANITIEDHYNNIGRTDIEIQLKTDHHIIIEAKIGKNHLKIDQNLKYPDCFDKVLHTNKKHLCFVTNDLSSNRIIKNQTDISIAYISWADIIYYLDRIKNKSDILHQFLYYYDKGYKMKNTKEVLVQDLKHESEIKRFIKYGVYIRDAQIGTPLYFAPHFTKDAEYIPETKRGGIFYFSEVCGVITGTRDIINSKAYKDLLRKFATELTCDENQKNEAIKKWEKGIKLKIENTQNIKTSEYSIYLLGETIELKHPFHKDGGINEGRGKNWIAAAISKNRCIPFKEFIRRM